MREEKYRRAGDVVNGVLNGQTAAAGMGLADAERWSQLALAVKLAELEEKWTQTAGSPVAQRSRPAACDSTNEGLALLIFVTDQTVLSAVRFRRNQLERRFSAFFGVPVKAEFRIGPVPHRANIKPAAAAADRRAPVVLDEKEVARESLQFSKDGLSAETAEKFARIKLSLEKLSKRSNAGQK